MNELEFEKLCKRRDLSPADVKKGVEYIRSVAARSLGAKYEDAVSAENKLHNAVFRTIVARSVRSSTGAVGLAKEALKTRKIWS